MKKFPIFVLFFVIALILIGLIFGFYKEDAKNIMVPDNDLENGNSNNRDKNEEESGEIVTEENEDLEKFLKRYDELLADIQLKQTKLSEKYRESTSKTQRDKILNDTKKYIYKVITSRMFPFWYGTEWDYNGITEKPKTGKIACGYLISTIMKHAGFMVERYKLAQQPSSLIIRTLALKTSIKRFTNIDELTDYFKSSNSSIYILGLKNHVGFVIKYKDKIKFVHSSYLDKKSVISEDLGESSKALKQSDVFITGNILDNVDLLEKWLLRRSIATKTN